MIVQFTHVSNTYTVLVKGMIIIIINIIITLTSIIIIIIINFVVCQLDCKDSELSWVCYNPSCKEGRSRLVLGENE